MKSFDTQSIEIQAGFHRAFTYIADAKTLPEWTHAFNEVSDGTAVMATPQGSVRIRLAINSSAEHGTIDWMMDFPDGSRATAFSRLIEAGKNRCIYTFTLMPPPAPMEQMEGALEQQAKTLREELASLARILSGRND